MNICNESNFNVHQPSPIKTKTNKQTNKQTKKTTKKAKSVCTILSCPGIIVEFINRNIRSIKNIGYNDRVSTTILHTYTTHAEMHIHEHKEAN